ncbi:hypothetical protein FK220_011905 [Flavobacteriaceae bacterium TP-CH-4]|uniref:Uncharacterized protein n=1 Tax=Pelagihabitans pacificus TaxID=2696054 RepID=A0A967ATE2_9FLAO|nr:hypothetical protein [Pelagihabitans pacificus]NHF60051.1 hypothetical protein [Pelagihabitans pacificus]
MGRLGKILLKSLLGLLLLGVIAFGVLYLVYNEPLPQGNTGPAADALAKKMLKAVNYEQYKATRFLEWTFAGGAHRYKWDKENGKVKVSWSNHQVNLNLNDPGSSTVLQDNVFITGEGKVALTQKALDYFNNDSFWLVAPFKVFDEGTERSLVQLEDGSKGLLVSYTTGGTTPGDSYLWKLDSSGFPKSYQMWVKIIPIGGLEATWDDWKVMPNGLFLPASHKIGPITLYIGNVEAYK